MARQHARFASIQWGVPAFVLLFLVLPQHASAISTASVFVNSSACLYTTCFSASQFGVLVGGGDALRFNGDTILNDIGLSTGATITTSGTNTIGSSSVGAIVDFSDNMTNSAAPCTGNTACTHPAGSTFSSGTTIYGGTRYDPTQVSEAYTQFTSISSYWHNQAASAPALPTQAFSGNWNIENSGTGIHVFKTTAGYSPSGGVVIGCGAAGNATAVNIACNPNDLLIIDVPAAQAVSILKSITFATASGLTDDQVLFLIEGTGANVLSINGSGAANNIVVHGDFFLWDTNGNAGGYTIGNGKTTTLDGRVFAALTSSPLTWNAGDTEANEPYLGPEPGTWALMGGGLAVGWWFWRRRRQVPGAEASTTLR